MYHDIRELETTQFGKRFRKRYELRSFITRKQFAKQINFIKNNSDIISPSNFLELNKNDKGNYSILTFDDGLLDHYEIQNILIDKHVNGTFFLPCEAITERKVILSHKIQFILAALDEKKIVSCITNELNDDRLWKKYSASKWVDNWWSPEMVFITNVLRKHSKGEELTNKLFSNFVTTDEVGFCGEFYLNINHVTQLINNGMYVGGHGYTSKDLSQMKTKKIEKEILRSVKFIKLFNDKYRFFSYPNGGYNEDVIKCMEKYQYNLAFTTKQEKFKKYNFNPLSVPRYDAPKKLSFL